MKINDPVPKSYTLPHPIWSQEELEGVKITHDPPKDKTETVRKREEEEGRGRGTARGREGGRERWGQKERERFLYLLISWLFTPGLVLCREDTEISL